MRLRPRQALFCERVIAALHDHDQTLGVAPTGAGKTIMLSAVGGQLLTELETPKLLVIQHRDELVQQNSSKFKLVNPTVSRSIVDANAKLWHGRAVFGMIQTLARNLDSIPALGAVIIDEAHHVTATSYQKVIDAAREKNPAVKILGVTATPNRGDGKPLRKTFDNVADQITISELIASGHLVRPVTHVLNVGTQDDLRAVRRVAADFDMGEVAKIMDKSIVTTAVIEHWKLLAGGRKTIVFCSTVEHARHVAESAVTAGIGAVLLHGDLSGAERRDVLKAFETGSAQWLVNVAVATEGYDYPPTSCVILLRPSSYKSTMVQMIGRGLRTVDPSVHPGVIKTDCIVLDFGTACLTHGSLEEAASLDERPKGEAPMMDCPGCGATVPISTLECPLCGFQWEREAKIKSELASIVLTEIDLLARSNFKWLDLWGADDALMCRGFDAWAGVFWNKGIWHAIGGSERDLKHLGVGDRTVALALADDFMNEHEDDKSAHKTKRWLGEPMSTPQLHLLQQFGVNVSQTEMITISKYRANCMITFEKWGDAITRRVFNYEKDLAA